MAKEDPEARMAEVMYLPIRPVAPKMRMLWGWCAIVEVSGSLYFYSRRLVRSIYVQHMSPVTLLTPPRPRSANSVSIGNQCDLDQ